MDAAEQYLQAREKFHAQKEERERRQQEQRQAAEAELQGSEDMREYMARREELRKRVLEPDAPLDEMSMSDFLKVRNRQERNAR